MARRTEHQLRQHVEGVNAYLQEFQREMGMPEEKWITIGLSAYSGGWSIVVMQDGAQLTTAYHDKLTYIDCTCVAMIDIFSRISQVLWERRDS